MVIFVYSALSVMRRFTVGLACRFELHSNRVSGHSHTVDICEAILNSKVVFARFLPLRNDR